MTGESDKPLDKLELDSKQLSRLKKVTNAIARGDSPRNILSHVLGLVMDIVGGSGCMMLVSEEQLDAVIQHAEISIDEVSLDENIKLVWEGPLAAQLQQHHGVTEPTLAEDNKLLVLPLAGGMIGASEPDEDVLKDPNKLVNLQILADLAAGATHVAIELSEAQQRTRMLEEIRRQLYQQNAMLQELAVVDDLTGLHNRRFFERRLTYEFDRFTRYAFPLALVLFDVDHFKQVNDTFGHNAGDAVLRHLANLSLDKIRNVDLLARYGGEEFVLLLPHTRIVGATSLAERLCESVAETPAAVGELMISVTVSVGVVAIEKGYEGSADDLFRAVDEALYRAKAAGRDRVMVSDTSAPTSNKVEEES